MIPDPAAPAPESLATSHDDRLLPPKDHLDPRARTMWYVSESIQCAVWVIAVGAGAWALIRFTDVTTWWVVVAATVFIAGSIVETIVSPAWRYRYWRYEIREDEVDLERTGLMVKTRQLIPMSRIQHVDTRRGPLQQRFGLSSVVFYTAAGSMEIPALSQERAADVRDRIAELAPSSR